MSATTVKHEPVTPTPPPKPDTWREWMMVATGLTALVAVIAAAVALVAFATNDKTTTKVVARTTTTKTPAGASAIAPAPKIEAAKGIAFEPFKPVDATLPAVPAGAVKKFTVDV